MGTPVRWNVNDFNLLCQEMYHIFPLIILYVFVGSAFNVFNLQTTCFGLYSVEFLGSASTAGSGLWVLLAGTKITLTHGCAGLVRGREQGGDGASPKVHSLAMG